MSPSRKHTVAVITACVAFVIFGFSFMFSSIALSIAPTTVLLCFRFTAAVLTLSLVVAANALVGRIRGKAWFSFSLRGKPLGGVLLLKDPFTPLQAVGVVVILVFVTLANLPKKQK